MPNRSGRVDGANGLAAASRLALAMEGNYLTDAHCQALCAVFGESDREA